MSKKLLIAALGAALFAAGCVMLPPPESRYQVDRTPSASAPPPAEEAPPAEPQADTCGIAAHAHLIGKEADDIDAEDLPPNARILYPDSIVTMDFSETRLNLVTNVMGEVSSLRCF
jgi:hypothetical protein